jgi:hypothetical protein
VCSWGTQPVSVRFRDPLPPSDCRSRGRCGRLILGRARVRPPRPNPHPWPGAQFSLPCASTLSSSCGAVAPALLLSAWIRSSSAPRPARSLGTTREHAVRARAEDRNRGRKPAPGVERLLIVLSVAERSPPPPGRLSGHARPVRGRRAANAARHAIALLDIGARRRRHIVPQSAAGAPSSSARRPDRLADYMGYCPHRREGHMRCGPHDGRTLSRRRRLEPAPPRRPFRTSCEPRRDACFHGDLPLPHAQRLQQRHRGHGGRRLGARRMSNGTSPPARATITGALGSTLARHRGRRSRRRGSRLRKQRVRAGSRVGASGSSVAVCT